jgi:hypothetical protein
MKAQHALLSVLIVVGCRVSGVDQEPNTELGQHSAQAASEIGPGTLRTEEFWVGSEQAEGMVPVKLEWESARAPDGCLRIKRASFVRTGGPRSVEIYDVKFSPFPNPQCVGRLDTPDDKFEHITLSYCWKWNGASNKAPCAYSNVLIINADAVGVEGIKADQKRPGAASSAKP